MIEVNGLTKYYGNFKAVDDLSLFVGAGQIAVLLGDNGAGKSTTLKSIVGLLKCEGDITICGYENMSVDAKKVLGYIPEVPILYDLLTVDEHIEFISKAYGISDYEPEAMKYLELFELVDKRKTIAKDLSKGMRQKLSMTLALVTKPKVLLVDEPLIGLDPQSIENVIALFQELRNSGTSILLSTHIIDTLGDIWDVAYIMHKGHVVDNVTFESLNGRNLKELFFEKVGGTSDEDNL